MIERDWASVLFVLDKRRLERIPPHPGKFKISTLERDFYRVGTELKAIIDGWNEEKVLVETTVEINILKKRITALALYEELETYRSLFGGEYLCSLYDLHYLATQTKASLWRQEPNISFIGRGLERIRVDLTYLAPDKLGIFANSLVARERNSPVDEVRDIWLIPGTHIITSRLY